VPSPNIVQESILTYVKHYATISTTMLKKKTIIGGTVHEIPQDLYQALIADQTALVNNSELWTANTSDLSNIAGLKLRNPLE